MAAIETRQVIRARARANDYWVAYRYGMSRPAVKRSCRRESATDRDRTSCKVIAAKVPRKRLKPRPEGRFAKGLKHAWQRKAAFWAAMRKSQGIAA